MQSRLEPNSVNICHIEERGWKAKPKHKMFTSRTAFLVVSVLFQVAKCSLGKLRLCIIDIQCKRIAVFPELNCLIAYLPQDSKLMHSSVSSLRYSVTNIISPKMRFVDPKQYTYRPPRNRMRRKVVKKFNIERKKTLLRECFQLCLADGVSDTLNLRCAILKLPSLLVQTSLVKLCIVLVLLYLLVVAHIYVISCSGRGVRM